jgi:hypothetical protein
MPGTTYLDTLSGRAIPPSIARLMTVANDLGIALCGQIVFLGGSVTPILETDRTTLNSPRPTKDVDGVTGATTDAKLFELEQALRARGFRNADQPPVHIGRWISPSDAIFDLVSAGSHTGGTGSERDQYAVESATTLDLPPVIRHVSSVGFLVLKLCAYQDRGTVAPRESNDLSDIVALVATRPELQREVSAAPKHVRNWIREDVRSLLKGPDLTSNIISHIADRDPLVDDVAERVLETLRTFASP